ncbi:hypothetical protein QZH41_006649 [Actinostola sp. cb2023]|nr:hypothetical protein QZH41_006649 [Actinostola sp. cb2023]
MTILRNLKNAGWDFHVSSLGLKRKTLADKNDFDIWMKGKAEVHLTDPRLSVRLNMSGEIATNSECFEEGKRRKRSLTQDENRSSDKPLQVLNVNEYFRASNLTLSPDFDISIELRKRIPKLPTHFDLNKALNSYILKQHRFDVNEILKEQFPALSSNFNINKELLMAVPELKRTFLFDEFLKKIVRNSVRLNSPINLKKDLGNLLPQLSSDFDSVLKRSLPQLRSLDSITTLIQAYLDDVVQFTLDQEKLKKFDINDIIKTRFRGLRRDVDINALLLQQIPQLDPKFNINKLIRNAVLGIGPQVDRLDELIAKTSGLPDFSLQKTLSKSFPGFDQRINFDELIKNEMKNMMSVKINDLKIKTLTFTNIIKSTIPKFNESNIDNILTTAFPSLEKKFNFREILKVHCPPGSYKEGLRGACIRCPLGAYQPQTGQMACIPCGPHKTTLREGTIDSTSCIMKETGPGKPYSLMIFSLSSSSIKTMWWKPRSGDVSHYELEYGYPGKSVLATIRIYPSNQPSGVSQYIIRGLEKYTVYKLKVYAVLDNERGKPATYDFRTQEDVPDASPQITSAVALNSSSVEVKWKELPLHARNGIILRYTVYCKASGYAAFDDKKAGRKELSTIDRS